MSTKQKQIYEKRLQYLVEILKAFKPKKIYAYGSWVSGNAKYDSDIDLMMIVDPRVDRLEMKKRFHEKMFESNFPYDLEPDVRIFPQDKFTYRLKNGDPFISEVAKGRLLYEN